MENSVFLGINVNELEFSKTDVGSKNTYAKVIYNQVYKGVPVDDGSLYVLVDSEENPRGEFRLIMNSSEYYPCIDVDVVPDISYETIPWLSSPINYQYGLAYSNASLTLPWEQGYSHIWATRGASWNQPYNYGWNLFNATWNLPYNYGYPRSSAKNNFYNYPYFSGYYDNIIPYDGPSTYFHLLPPDSILWNDPYTLAIMASQ